MEGDLDARVRIVAFQWLHGQVALHGDTLPRVVLAEGLMYQGRRVPLLGPQATFKLAVSRLPLSITTSPNSPYADRWGADHLEYAYRGTDPRHPDNVGLRAAMREQIPLVYFHGIAPDPPLLQAAPRLSAQRRDDDKRIGPGGLDDQLAASSKSSSPSG